MALPWESRHGCLCLTPVSWALGGSNWQFKNTCCLSSLAPEAGFSSKRDSVFGKVDSNRRRHQCVLIYTHTHTHTHTDTHTHIHTHTHRHTHMTMIVTRHLPEKVGLGHSPVPGAPIMSNHQSPLSGRTVKCGDRYSFLYFRSVRFLFSIQKIINNYCYHNQELPKLP